MSEQQTMQVRQLEVRGRPARVFAGGPADAPALLLIHGGWGGAELHWSPVWERLAARYRVLAPDLPGLGHAEQPPLQSVAEYARWLVALLDALGIARAVCVGNSFGGSVAWALAGRTPSRCAGLVLVNGIPMPRTPQLLRRLGESLAGAAIARAVVRRVAYHPSALARAFVDVSRAPAALREMLARRGAELAPRFAALLVAGDGSPTPPGAPLLLWGEGDRLIGTRAEDAGELHASLPGSVLRLIPEAGHFPQLEAPEEFAAQLEALLD